VSARGRFAADAVAIAERYVVGLPTWRSIQASLCCRDCEFRVWPMAGQLQPDLEALMSAADRALYRAKELGRNKGGA